MIYRRRVPQPGPTVPLRHCYRQNESRIWGNGLGGERQTQRKHYVPTSLSQPPYLHNPRFFSGGLPDAIANKLLPLLLRSCSSIVSAGVAPMENISSGILFVPCDASRFFRFDRDQRLLELEVSDSGRVAPMEKTSPSGMLSVLARASCCMSSDVFWFLLLVRGGRATMGGRPGSSTESARASSFTSWEICLFLPLN